MNPKATIVNHVKNYWGKALRFAPARVPQHFHDHKDKRQVVESDCFVGIEIEAENFHGFCVETSIYDGFFAVAGEGSLRDHGIEFKIPPINGKSIVTYLNILDHINKCLSLKYNDLTGLHVHLNMQFSTIEQLANTLLTYLVFESALFKYSGGRHSSIYCLPLQQSRTGISNALNLEFDNAIRQSKKYSALNLLPLVKFGTLEFRHAIGTNDTTMILNWINLLLRIWNFAHSQDYAKLRGRIYEMNHLDHYREFASEVFKDQLELLPIPHLWNTMPEGIAFVKQCFAPTETLTILDTVVKKDRRRASPVKKPLEAGPERNRVFRAPQLVDLPRLDPQQWNIVGAGGVGVVIIDDNERNL